MKNHTDFSTSLASFILAFLMVGNDVIASASALANFDLDSPGKYISIPEFKAEAINVESTNPYQITQTTPSVKVVDKVSPNKGVIRLSSTSHAYLGIHSQDPLHSPEDDFFVFRISSELKSKAHVILKYEIQGLKNPSAIAKSFNNHPIYYQHDLQKGTAWQSVKLKVDQNDLEVGENSLRFSLPQNFMGAVTIRNVQLLFSEDDLDAESSLRLERVIAENGEFEIRPAVNAVMVYRLSGMDMPSIPNNIINVTKGANGYLMQNNQSDSSHITMGYRQDMVSPGTGISNMQMFYFDQINKTWRPVADMDIDHATGQVSGNAPSNTDYFTGMITTPEMPEASAFVPTAISDIKAANPAAGLNIMQPPVASRTGEASLSYPLDIPAGRNGLAPQLALNYNSDGGTGWLGMGWSISIPQVAVDVKLGVPRFPAEQEEGYTLNGDELVMEDGYRPGKSATVPGRTSEPVRFFPRTMQSFKKIERVGGSTSTYYWVETMPDQTKYYYGSDGSGTFDAVLTDNAGNIVKWYLKRVEDRFGNYIQYSYESGSSSSPNEVKDGGKYVILTKIDYTLHTTNSSLGKYSVEFNTSTGRSDATVNLKYGVKEIDYHQLDNIKVKYGTTTELKEFRFVYETGISGKKRLKSLKEYRSGKSAVFSEHYFDYYDQALNYGPRTSFSTNLPKFDQLFSNMPDEVNAVAGAASSIIPRSTINTSTNVGWGANGSIGAGVIIYNPRPSQDKNITVSGRLGYSESTNNRKIFLEDFNGDGLPDLVFDNGEKTYYPILKDQNDDLYFGKYQTISQSSPFGKNKSSNWTWGVDITMPFNIFYYGLNWGRSKSKSTYFLTDYNADGFQDLVTNGVVQFGKLSPNGNYSFDFSSLTTYNPVTVGATPVAVQDEPLKDLEIVRTWEAPFTGNINISGTAYCDEASADGAMVGVQKNSSFIPGLEMTSIPIGGDVTMTKVGYYVTKGDKLLFRTYAKDNGYNDFVKWNPKVKYQNLVKLDASGVSYTNSTYEEGFLLSSGYGIYFKGDNAVKVEWPTPDPTVFTDDVTFGIRVVVQNSSTESIVSENYYEKTIPAGTPLSLAGQFTNPATSQNATFLSSFGTINGASASDECIMSFEVKSHSNIDWQAINWRPEVKMGDDPCGEPKRTIFPTVLYNTYNKVNRMDGPYTDLPSGAGTDKLRAWPDIDCNNYSMAFHPDEIAAQKSKEAYFVVKTNGTLLAKMIFRLNYDGTCSFYDISTQTSLNLNDAPHIYSFSRGAVLGDLYMGFHTEDKMLAAFLDTYTEAVGIYNVDGAPIMEDLTSAFDIFHIKREWHQDNLLGWGQFCWSNPGNPVEAIGTAQMVFVESGEEPDYRDGEEPSPAEYSQDVNEDSETPMDKQFGMLMAVRGENVGRMPSQIEVTYGSSDPSRLDRWSAWGQHTAAYRKEGATAPGKFGEPEPEPVISVPPEAGNYIARAIATESRSKSLAHNLMAGVGQLSLGESATFNNPSKYNTTTIASYMDMNGDGYPDILTNDGITTVQYTLPSGGYGQSGMFVTGSGNQALGISTTNESGQTVAGSFINDDKATQKTLNISGTQSFGNTTSTYQWADVNGDGMPDRLSQSGGYDVELNYGKGILSPKEMRAPGGTLNRSQSSAYNLGATGGLSNLQALDGFQSKSGGSFSAGIGVNAIANKTINTFMDMNGDGLSDIVYTSGSSLEICFNLGTEWSSPVGFASQQINENQTFGIYANISGTGALATPLTPPLIGLKFSGTVGLQGNFSLDFANSTFMDMNGDGVMDIVWSNSFGELEVQFGDIGNSNLLKSVTNPLGGSFTIDYKRIGNKRGHYPVDVLIHTTNEGETMLWDMPFSKLVMSELTINDGVDVLDHTSSSIDGYDNMHYYFDYDGGIKSRRERDFIGFTRVKTSSERDFPLSDLLSGTESESKYTAQITDYSRPLALSPDYLRRFSYLKGIPIYQYQYFIVDATEDDPENPGMFILKHPTFYIMSQSKNTYEPRQIILDKTSADIGLVNKDGGNWVIVNWNSVTETEAVFMALVEKEEMSFPDYLNQSLYHPLRYKMRYDNYMNCEHYSLDGANVVTGISQNVIGTIVNQHYEYKVEQFNYSAVYGQTSPFNGVTPDPVTGDLCFTIPCSDPSFNDANMCIPGFVVNTKSCYGPALSDLFDVQFRKLVTTTTPIIENSPNCTYHALLIADMDYFTPGSAANRTNVLKEHEIFVGTEDSQGFRRGTEAVLTTSMKSTAKIINRMIMGGSTDPNDDPNTDLSYNTYGQVTAIKGPINDKGTRLETRFNYDSEVSQFVESVDNDYGDQTCYKYDFGTGNLLRQIGINGHATAFVYDDNFRLKEVYGPREYADPTSAPTISFQYKHRGMDSSSTTNYRQTVPVAVTLHNMGVSEVQTSAPTIDCEDPDDFSSRPDITTAMHTATFMDGNQRVIQIKKESALESGGVNIVSREVSGLTSLDYLGREVSTTRTALESVASADIMELLNAFATDENELALKKAYDFANRPTSVETIRESYASFQKVYLDYEWTSGDAVFADPYFTVYSTIGMVPNIKAQIRQYKDVMGQTIASVTGEISSGLITYFDMDAAGQLNSTTDGEGFETKYTYDALGRMIKENHVDRGVTDFVYDKASNLLKKITPITGAAGITMEYHYNRLVQQIMPDPQSAYNVQYSWGSKGDGKNGAGRIVSIDQGQGFLNETFAYDELGNRVDEFRDFYSPTGWSRSYSFEYKYDSWGRMREMTYPDGERLEYSYYSTGELSDIYSYTVSDSRYIVEELLYDGLGNIKKMEYGNSSVTDFEYDSYSRKLKQFWLNDGHSSPSQLLHKVFTYDVVGNVAGVTNHAGPISIPATPSNPASTIGGTYNFEYHYDEANRLQNVSNSIFDTKTYTLNMGNESSPGYNKAGGILKKTQSYDGVAYDLNYNYEKDGQGDPKSHKIDYISDGAMTWTYEYDNAGNILEVDPSNASKELFTFNKLNYLTLVDNPYGTHHYMYDYKGDRVLKNSILAVGGANNGESSGSVQYTMDAYTLYVNPYYVVKTYVGNEQGTKHYYMNSQRVASAQMSYTILMEEPPPSYDLESDETPRSIYDLGVELQGLNERLDEPRDIDLITLLEPKNPNTAMSYEDYQFALDEEGCETVECRCAQSMYWAEYDGFNCQITRTMYWYHPDYLGNVEWVTKADGTAHQFFWYTPWGEPLENQHAGGGTFGSRYKFNAKELDDETGNYYYGARYYDPKVSIWLSVDPMASSFAQVTPYSAFLNNPVMMIDPGGDSTFFFDADGNHLGTTDDGLDNAVTIVDKGGVEGALHIINDINAGKYKGEKKDEMAQNARDHGQSYDYKGMIEFGEKNTTLNSNGDPQEVGSYLYMGENGVIRLGSEKFEGSTTFTIFGKAEEKNPLGRFHTHPGLYGNAPSDEDYHYSPFSSNKYRDVIQTSSYLIFYNTSNSSGSNRYDYTMIPIRKLR